MDTVVQLSLLSRLLSAYPKREAVLWKKRRQAEACGFRYPAREDGLCLSSRTL